MAYGAISTTPASFTAAQPDPTHFNTAMTISPAGTMIPIFICITVGAATDLSIAFLGSLTGASDPSAAAQLYACDTGNFVMGDGLNALAGTLSLNAIPAGTYFLYLNFRSLTFGASTTDCAFSLTASHSMVVNPVIALWDDSGTTRKLWACPKLLLPPLTEATGDWYASCADAAAAITSKTSNCVGYCDSFDTFTATDGGTSLELFAEKTVGAGMNAMTTWGGINAGSGDTIKVTFNSAGQIGVSSTCTATLYDDTGAVVDSQTNVEPFGPQSHVFNFAAAPYTGRYTISVYYEQATLVLVQSDAVITSSGPLSVNPIQACYDLGLDCPGALNCGDACP